ncbi:MAG: hypothetical protein ACAI44_16090, partial [Candidatus Sericytochromatia bacterium]
MSEQSKEARKETPKEAQSIPLDWLRQQFLPLSTDLDPGPVLGDPVAGLGILAANPQAAGLDLLLGWCLLQIDRPEAGVILEAGLNQFPGQPLPHLLLGLCYGRHGQIEAAMQQCLTAWKLASEDLVYFSWMLRALLEMTCFTAQTMGQPPGMLLEATVRPLLEEVGKYPQLLEALWQICLEQDFEPGPELVKQLARTSVHHNQPELGRQLLTQLIGRQAGRVYLELTRACLLPLIYADSEEIPVWRDRCRLELEAALAALENQGDTGLQQLAADIDGVYLPIFLLAYQNLGNRPIYDRLGDFWHQALSRMLRLPAPQNADQNVDQYRLRIGLVSAHFREHAVSHAFLGLIAFLHRQGVEVLLFTYQDQSQTQSQVMDPIQTRLPEICSRVVPLPPELPRAVGEILAAGLDVLIYPEIGMDFNTYLLAALRLAPLQLALSGHPESSGLPSIDYFVSTRDREGPQADAHYRERLLLLERMPAVFSAPEPPPAASRAELGLPLELADKRLYLCPMTPFKIHPENDQLFAGILAADPEAWILLFEYGQLGLTQALRERLDRSLSEHAARVLFLPFMTPVRFHQLLLQSEVCLDSRGFGGGNTARQALGLGVPMVTWPGEYLKQRMVLELCTQLEVPELVTSSAGEYVARAVAIAKDRD